MKSKRIGVLGLGSIGARHLGNVVAAGAVPVGFDPNETTSLSFADSGVEIVSSPNELVCSNLDGLVIASPSGLHLNHLALALEHNVPCLVEKPLTTTEDGVEDIISRAESKGIAICAALNLRFHPCVEKAKDLLGEGAIGHLTHAYFEFSDWMPGWRPTRDYRQIYAADPVTGGVIFDDIHEFDLACHLVGPAAVSASVATRSGCLDMAAEDRADIVLSHENGAQSALHLSYCSRGRCREFSIAGDEGRISVDLDLRTLVLRDIDGVRTDLEFDGDYASDYQSEMKDFLAVIDGQVPRCTGRDAWKVLRCVLEARRSAGLPQS